MVGTALVLHPSDTLRKKKGQTTIEGDLPDQTPGKRGNIMKRLKYVPTRNDKAVIRRFMRALRDAGLADSITMSDITVSSRGFSITGLSLNEFSAFTNQIEDIAQLASVQRGVSRKHKTMTAAVKESRPLPADYTRARVVKKTGVRS